VGLNEVQVYVKAGSIIPRQDPDGEIHAGHIHDLILDVYPNSGGTRSVASGATGGLYEDDGCSPAYREGSFCRTQFTLTGNVLADQVVEGKPLSAKRRITVVVAAETPLAPAMLNGRTKIAPEPHGTNRYRFVLPELPAGKPWELTLDPKP
jgi:alpha-glucosidase (family GH31 glycosyl hydrolase)